MDFFSLTIDITESVKSSQPFEECEFASPFSTDNILFSKRTPCSAQDSRHPLEGIDKPKSLCNSLNIFCNEGGILTPSGTEKQSP